MQINLYIRTACLHDVWTRPSDRVRRGKEVYEQVFAPCHSLNFIKFRHFEAFMSKEEVKAMAAEFEVDDIPDDEVGPNTSLNI